MNFQTPEEAQLTFLLFVSMLILALSIACSAEAYIPSSQFVFDRLTSQHGKGTYIIDDEVSITEGKESSVLKENWIVIDGGEMRLFAQGSDGTRVFRIMKRGRLFWVDESGSERSTEIPTDNPMRFLMMRTSSEEERLFIQWNVLPVEVLREKKAPKDVKNIELTSDAFARLGRAGGTVAIVYGKPSPPNGTPNAGVWIEQDQFNIRKMRAPDLSEIYFNDYAGFSKGLIFPKSQTIQFDNHTFQVRMMKISNVELSLDSKRQFDLNWLRSRPDVKTNWSSSALTPVIQEFYRRFR